MAKKVIKDGTKVILVKPLKIISGVLIPGTEVLVLKHTKTEYLCSVNRIGLSVSRSDLENSIRRED